MTLTGVVDGTSRPRSNAKRSKTSWLSMNARYVFELGLEQAQVVVLISPVEVIHDRQAHGIAQTGIAQPPGRPESPNRPIAPANIAIAQTGLKLPEVDQQTNR